MAKAAAMPIAVVFNRFPSSRQYGLYRSCSASRSSSITCRFTKRPDYSIISPLRRLTASRSSAVLKEEAARFGRSRILLSRDNGIRFRPALNGIPADIVAALRKASIPRRLPRVWTAAVRLLSADRSRRINGYNSVGTEVAADRFRPAREHHRTDRDPAPDRVPVPGASLLPVLRSRYTLPVVASAADPPPHRRWSCALRPASLPGSCRR